MRELALFGASENGSKLPDSKRFAFLHAAGPPMALNIHGRLEPLPANRKSQIANRKWPASESAFLHGQRRYRLANQTRSWWFRAEGERAGQGNGRTVPRPKQGLSPRLQPDRAA